MIGLVVFFVALGLGFYASVTVAVWFAHVVYQVDMIQRGHMDPHGDRVIGAARWWTTGSLE